MALLRHHTGRLRDFNHEESPRFGSFPSSGMNVAGLLVITLWTVGLCSLMFGLLKLVGLLRVDRQSEIVGMDIVKHGEPAYPVAAYGGDFRHLAAGNQSSVTQNGVPIVMPKIHEFKVTKNEEGNNNPAYEGDAPV